MDDAATLAAVLGAVVRAERCARGLTQADLARAAGVHPMALSKVERGAQQDVGVATLAQLAAALAAAGPQACTASSLIARAERWRARLGPVAADAHGGVRAAVMRMLADVAAEA